MTILLFGISNIGKNATGKLLASYLDYDFYDLDEEVKKKFGITLEEFVSTGTLRQRDAIRCDLLLSLVACPSDKVIAVTPLSYAKSIQVLFSAKDVLAIELRDSVQNIFDRLVFSDEDDNLYKDDEYKNKHKEYYLREIKEDFIWYGFVYSKIKNKFDIDGKDPVSAAKAIIQKFQLTSESEV